MKKKNTLNLCVKITSVGKREEDPEHRKLYEKELRDQMDHKKQLEEAKKAKEREEEVKMEKRALEQQERMKKEFDEELSRKKAKEEAVRFSDHQLWKTGYTLI